MKKVLFLISLFLLVLVGCKKSNHYQSFDEYPVYEGNDLEMIYSPQVCRFRVWAPTADGVKLLLYDNGNEGGAYKTIDMKSDENGTWKLEVEENLKGKFYTFQIKIGEKWLDETPGANVKATGVNGKRGAIIDFRDTDPEGWESDVRPQMKNFTDIIEYEVHVRDFSISASSGMKYRGKFLAFTEHGTKNATGQLTGIDHLKELGITHVHLLPCFDFDSIDESNTKNTRNDWGYSAVNFTVPEGIYSTNAKDPKSRIREFKRLVQSLHKSGIRVILDVAYSHTTNASNSNLNLLVPGYYYRHNADSTFSNGTGYGNETASEQPMMRKLMIESMVFWASEYHVDGFNFQQMGAHDLETLNSVREALDKVDPTIFLSGDGKLVGNSVLPQEKRGVLANAERLDFIAVYNQDLYHGIMDSIQVDTLKNVKFSSFIYGRDSLAEKIKFGILGATEHPQVDLALVKGRTLFVNNPTQVINYSSKHTELCLTDLIDLTKPIGSTAEEITRYHKLIQSIIFTSQGIMSIHGGDEISRTKNGIAGGCYASDSITQINWNNKTEANDLFLYYQGLISLRKKHAAFRIPTQEMTQQYLTFLETPSPNVVGYVLMDHVNGDKWKDVMVIYNANRYPVKVNIPAGQWNVVCHDAKINQSGLFQIQLRDTIFSVPATSTSIMFDE
jgi:pullulanase